MIASLIENSRFVYNNLGDELSKRIYENKLLYSLTEDYRFISNIVNLSFPVDEYNNLVRSKFKNSPVIIYGAGFVGLNFLQLCTDVNVRAFCDSEESKQGSLFCDHKVISPEELANDYSDCAVAIAVFDSFAEKEIITKLERLGISKEKIVTIDDIVPFRCDLRKAYFHPDIILPQQLQNEVFIDGGCYDFRTSQRFKEYCKENYENIIAFEPNPKQYTICEERAGLIKNATVYPYALWDNKAKLEFDNTRSSSAHISSQSESTMKIKAVKLDDILNGEKATFIKMDVEGAELNALKGAELTIREYRPKLAISIYHKPEDIWEIPGYILSLYSDYRLFIRHYSLIFSETILYAI